MRWPRPMLERLLSSNRTGPYLLNLGCGGDGIRPKADKMWCKPLIDFRNHLQEPLAGTTCKNQMQERRNHLQGPLARTTCRNHLQESLARTSCRNNSQKPLAGTTCRNNLQEPLAGTARRNRLQEPLPPTTCRNHLQEPLAGTTCKNHLQEPLAGTTSRNHLQEPLAGTTRKNRLQEPLAGIPGHVARNSFRKWLRRYMYKSSTRSFKNPVSSCLAARGCELALFKREFRAERASLEEATSSRSETSRSPARSLPLLPPRRISAAGAGIIPALLQPFNVSPRLPKLGI